MMPMRAMAARVVDIVGGHAENRVDAHDQYEHVSPVL